MGVEAIILFAVIMISAGVAMGLAALVAIRRQVPGTKIRGVISALCLVSGAVILLAIDNSAGDLLFDFLFGLGSLTGLAAVIAYICRARLSRLLGMISVGSFFILMLHIWLNSPGPEPLDAIYFLLFATPGLIGIFCKRAPRPQPGICTKCGYNLTGNVSGKCSECGTPVPAP